MSVTPISFLICCTPRSGSTLLCDLMAQTGVAGRPNSFFRQGSLARFASDFGIADPGGITPAYLQAAQRFGITPNSCFGMRLQADNLAFGLAALRRHEASEGSDLAVLERAFGPLRFIHLSRADKLAQAVSYARAECTGTWHKHTDGSVREQLGPVQEPRYNRATIARHLARSEAEDQGWRRWFAGQGITPYKLRYEALAADPMSEVADILRFLDPDSARAKVVKPATARLADPVSRSWIARFQQEGDGLPPDPRSATPRA